MISGIYSITNNTNGKVYIGQSEDIEDRLRKHKSALKGNYHVNSHLQSSWNKYGEDSFTFKLVKSCKLRYLDRFEKLIINIYDATNPDNGYNLKGGGRSNCKYSDASRKKMSDSHKGVKLSEETRLNMSKAQNTTGYYRVHKLNNSRYSQGFIWAYYYYVNGKQNRIYSVSLDKLKEKVIARGLEWREL